MLKILNISVRNSSFAVSVNLNRLFRIRSNCRKFGPRRALRGRFPKVPGAGVAKAAGFNIDLSLFRYGLTPETMLGLLILRELPPPGVLTTAVKPGLSAPDGRGSTCPAIQPAAGFVHT